MSCFLKQPKWFLSCVNFLIVKNRRINTFNSNLCLVNFASQIRCCGAVQSKCLLVSNYQSRLILSRNASRNRKKKQGKQYDEESSDEEEEEEDEEEKFIEKGADIKTYSVQSLRMDSLLKSLLGVSRKTVEESFYQKKIRINGELVNKKSHNVNVNDEIDLIKGVDNISKNTIVVGRVKILKIEPDPDENKILLKAWKSKSLKINNYEGRNAWEESQE